MSTTEPATSAETAKKGGFIFAFSTLIAMGFTSTVAQMVAWSIAGLPVSLEWSTGGLLAVVSSIAMWIWCRSWGTWWKWIWLPAAIIVVVAVLLANTAAENYREAQLAQTCSGWEAEMADLVSQGEALLAEAEGYEPASWLTTDWEKFGKSDAEIVAIDQRRAQEYFDTHGGLELEERFIELRSQYSATC